MEAGGQKAKMDTKRDSTNVHRSDFSPLFFKRIHAHMSIYECVCVYVHLKRRKVSVAKSKENQFCSVYSVEPDCLSSVYHHHHQAFPTDFTTVLDSNR